MISLAQRITELRTEKGMSRPELSAALGLPKPWLDGALRISFSPDSTRDEADRLVSALKGAADRLFTTLS